MRDKWVYNNDFRGMDWQQVHDEYAPRVAAAATSESFYALMHELIKKLGDYRSIFLSPQEIASLNQTATGVDTFGGIGATLKVVPEGGVILQVVQGAPADLAGLKPGDMIQAVEGVAYSTLEASNPGGGVATIRGPVGTSVRLSVQSPDGKSRSLDITRAVISSSATPESAIQVSRLPGTQVGLLIIINFSSPDLPTQINTQLQKLLLVAPLDGLIIDVRRSQGVTSDNQMRGTLALFNDGGSIGAYRGPSINSLVNIPQGATLPGLKNVPIVVLTSRDTEGVKEIFASGMQVLKRARIVGMPSNGVTEVRSTYNLPDGSQLLLGVGFYLRPDGTSIEGKGVQPDRVVDGKWYIYLSTPGDDPQIKGALEELRKK